MQTQDTFQQMLEQIEATKLGVYHLIQGGDCEDQIFKVNDSIVSSHPYLNTHTLLLEEMIANAVLRGNNKDPLLIASIKVIEGNKGWVVRIRDSGEGFDVNTTLKTGAYQFAGTGLTKLKSRDNIEFNYEHEGSTLNILGLYK